MTLLDQGATHSLISQEAAKRAQMTISTLPKPRVISGLAGPRSYSKEATVTIFGRHGGYHKTLTMPVLPSITTVDALRLSPKELGFKAKELADEWPRKRRKLDIILGNDVLEDVFLDGPRLAIKNQPKLKARPTIFGLVVSGQHKAPASSPPVNTATSQQRNDESRGYSVGRMVSALDFKVRAQWIESGCPHNARSPCEFGESSWVKLRPPVILVHGTPVSITPYYQTKLP